MRPSLGKKEHSSIIYSFYQRNFVKYWKNTHSRFYDIPSSVACMLAQLFLSHPSACVDHTILPLVSVSSPEVGESSGHSTMLSSAGRPSQQEEQQEQQQQQEQETAVGDKKTPTMTTAGSQSAAAVVESEYFDLNVLKG